MAEGAGQWRSWNGDPPTLQHVGNWEKFEVAFRGYRKNEPVVRVGLACLRQVPDKMDVERLLWRKMKR